MATDRPSDPEDVHATTRDVEVRGRRIHRVVIDAGCSATIEDCDVGRGILVLEGAALDLHWSMVLDGVRAARHTSIEIVGSVLSRGTAAVNATEAARVRVVRSRLVGLRIGILARSVLDLHVAGNEISRCGEAGIVLEDGHGPTGSVVITDNLIDLNGCGILTGLHGEDRSESVHISDNDIIGNYQVSGMVPQAVWGDDGANLRLLGATVALRGNRFFECTDGPYRLPEEHYVDRRDADFWAPVSLERLPRDWARPRPNQTLVVT